jgi:uncharacterized protein DUF58
MHRRTDCKSTYPVSASSMIHIEQKRTGIQCVQVSLSELLQLSQMAKLSLSTLRIKSSQTGTNQSRLLGRGMEFAESRRYQIGDDVRNIDWRVTARSGKAHTKLFAAEKERQVLLCVDMRSSMFFATRGVFKSVQASLMAGLITWNAVQTGNRVGGMIFDDENQYEFRPALGKKGALPFLEQLAKSATFEAKKKPVLKDASKHNLNVSTAPKSPGLNDRKSPNISEYGVTYDRSTAGAFAQSKRSSYACSHPTMDDAIGSMKRHISPGCLLFILSDFRHLSQGSRDMLVQMARHADIRLCFIYDALESALPHNGKYPVTDGERKLDLNTFDKKSVEKYHQQFIERKEKIDSLGNHNHIHCITCTTEDDYLENLKNHFRL